MFKRRFAGDNIPSDDYHNGMHRQQLDKYMLGYDFPIPAKGIYELNLIAEKITAERGEPMTYENIRRNGIEYGERAYGRLSVDSENNNPFRIKDTSVIDPDDPDTIAF